MSGTRRITWLGHATVLVEAGGARLLTDPVLRDRVAHLRRRAATPADTGRLDAVLVSHQHHDHLDRPSLRRVAGPEVAAVVPVGVARLLQGFGEIHEVRAGDTVEVGGLEIEAVPAWHDGRRGPGTKPLDTLGFLFDGVWFAGDTDFDPEMEELRGRVDVALVPIWGWGPSLGPGHLDPKGAARVVELVQPRVVIPIHWGTFLPIGLGKRYARVLTDPPREFASLVGSTARVEAIAPGGSVEL